MENAARLNEPLDNEQSWFLTLQNLSFYLIEVIWRADISVRLLIAYWQLQMKVPFKLANPASFLFIFALFKHKFYRKSVGFSRIRTLIVGIEGKHADLLTQIK